METPQAGSAPRSSEAALTTCQHTENCCLVPQNMIGKVGKKWATALAGFVAGAVVAAIILVPWMLFQGKLCDVKSQSTNTSINPKEAPPEGEMPAPAPAPGEAPAPTPAPPVTP